jgi:hypothetical protein
LIKFSRAPLSIVTILALLSGCAQPSRMGMVKDPQTGLQFGSVVEKNLVTDASFYENKKIKVRIRNTSGDTAFDLYRFQSQIEEGYRQAGYTPTSDNNFGLLVDVNVMYSGQIQTNLMSQYAFLGAAAGGLAGASRGSGLAVAVGTIGGATLGSIIGSYVTDETYIIVARATFGIVGGGAKRDGKRITFSRSITGNPEDFEKREEREERRRRRSFKSTHSTKISVFSGGRNATQGEIAGQVRSRIVRIIRDII